MKELSLFSGAGGGLLGTHLLGWRPVGYVEWNDYCQRIIAARIKDGILPDAPIFGDIHAFNREGYAASYQGLVDVVTGGFPCQPFSLAGKRQGAADERNGWPATIECLRIIRPEWALLENVPGLLVSGYFDTILGDLAESGFDVGWRVLSAAEVGAPHKRDRLWIVAHANRREQGRGKQPQPGKNRGNAHIAGHGAQGSMANANQERWDGRAGEQWSGWGRQFENSSNEDVSNAVKRADEQGITRSVEWPISGSDGESNGAIPNASSAGLSQPKQKRQHGGSTPECDWWTVEPDVGRVANGVANRVDRLKALGNGQVPAVVRAAWLLMSPSE